MNPIANGTRAILHGIDVTHLRSSDGATAIVADHGGHLLSWCPVGGSEALYLSPLSGHGNGQAIRGGVPVIFPQFGEQGQGMRHGIARVRPWTLLSAGLDDGVAVARLALQGRLDGQGDGKDDDKNAFRLVLEVRLQDASLQLALTVHNIGSAPWSFQAALHTYLRVDGLGQCAIDGLQGSGLIDQVAGGAVSIQPQASLRFAGEIDRIYTDAPASLLLRDGSRRMTLGQQGFADTVVWNPGAVKAAALSDLKKGGEQAFVCIEAAAIARRPVLAPGASWHAMQRLQVVSD